MKNGLTILLSVVIGILLLGSCYLGWNYYQVNKESKKKDFLITSYQKAPVKVVVQIKDSLIYVERVRTITSNHTDTIIKGGDTVYWNDYKDTLKTSDFDLFYSLRTFGTLSNINFLTYRLHTKEITRTITLDTCFLKPPTYTAINHFGVIGGVGMSNFTSFPIFSAGFFYTVKDRWGLQPGIFYNPVNSRLYGSLNLMWYFK